MDVIFDLFVQKMNKKGNCGISTVYDGSGMILITSIALWRQEKRKYEQRRKKRKREKIF